MSEPFPNSHPDPLKEALSASAQKVAELTFIAALGGQVAGRRARKGDGPPAADGDQAQFEDDRKAWQAVFDPVWRADRPGLRDVAQAWGAAARWEHADEGAAAAVEEAENLLRQLHPYAMARYDELRQRQPPMSRAEAMMATVPDFALHPAPRTAPQYHWQNYGVLHPVQPGPAPGISVEDLPVVQRLLTIIARLSFESAAAGRGQLSPEAAGAWLRSHTTGASDTLIGQVVDGLKDETLSLPVYPPPAARPTVANAGPGAANWPGTIQDGLQAATRRPGRGGRRGHAATAGPRKTRKPHGPGL